MKALHFTLLFAGLVLSFLVCFWAIEWLHPATRLNHQSYLAEYAGYRAVYEMFRSNVYLFAAPAIACIAFAATRLKLLTMFLALIVANGLIVLSFFAASILL